MMTIISLFVFGLLLSSSMAQEGVIRCGYHYYLPCIKPQLERANSLLGFEGAPQEEYMQRLRDFPYNPPSYGEKKSHVKSFRPRIPLLRY